MFFKILTLPLTIVLTDLNKSVFQLRIKLWSFLCDCIENILGQMSFPAPLLDHLKSSTTKQNEHLHQLPSNKATEEGIDTTGGKKVTGLANPVAWGHVITILRVIKGLLHKVCKADAIRALNLL